MRRLLVSAGAVALVYLPFHAHIAVNGDAWNTLLFWLGLILFAVSVVVMLVGTRDWHAHNLGLFWVCVGLTVLFGRRLLLDWTTVSSEVWADLFRASLVVGGTLTLGSLLGWLRDWWRARPGRGA